VLQTIANGRLAEKAEIPVWRDEAKLVGEYKIFVEQTLTLSTNGGRTCRRQPHFICLSSFETLAQCTPETRRKCLKPYNAAAMQIITPSHFCGSSRKTFLKMSRLLYKFNKRSLSLSRCAESLAWPHGK